MLKAFLQQLRKLSANSSFDALWRNILELFSVFLAVEQFGGKIPQEFGTLATDASAELIFTLDTCSEQLKKMLHTLANSNLFHGPENLQRWSFTYDLVTRFRNGPQMLTELFESPSRDSHPIISQHPFQSDSSS